MSSFSAEIDKIAAALAKAQAEYKPILKTKQASVKGESKKSGKSFSYGYYYADIADVLEVGLPILSKQGISAIQPTYMVGNQMLLHTRLMHSSGQWVASEYPVCTVGLDHQDMGGALTYARRYALSSLAGFASDEDKDGNGNTDAKPGPVKRTREEWMAAIAAANSVDSLVLVKRAIAASDLAEGDGPILRAAFEKQRDKIKAADEPPNPDEESDGHKRDAEGNSGDTESQNGAQSQVSGAADNSRDAPNPQGEAAAGAQAGLQPIEDQAEFAKNVIATFAAINSVEDINAYLASEVDPYVEADMLDERHVEDILDAYRARLAQLPGDELPDPGT